MREEYNKLGFMRESLQVEIDRLSIVKQQELKALLDPEFSIITAFLELFK